MRTRVYVIDKTHQKDIHNLFHPLGDHKPESYDEVKILDALTSQTKRFLPLLLKELYSLLKPNGIFIFTYNPNRLDIKEHEIEKIFWKLFGIDAEYIDTYKKRGKATISYKKLRSVLVAHDSISKWSFGMVTNGVRKDFIKKSIESIRSLKIPEYEIIVCGKYPFPIENDIIYIPFTKRDDRGWITKKKNLIANEARFKNLCIFHDRIVFSKKWYKAMRHYGNVFEVLTCRQLLKNGTRVGDWVHSRKPYGTRAYQLTIEQLDYKDWTENVYIGGMFTIIKKHVWEKIPWNETLYWHEAEDIELSVRLVNAGYIPRINPQAECLSLSWNFGLLPEKQFTASGKESFLWKLQNVPMRRFVRSFLYNISAFPFACKWISYSYSTFGKTRLYKYFSSH